MAEIDPSIASHDASRAALGAERGRHPSPSEAGSDALRGPERSAQGDGLERGSPAADGVGSSAAEVSAAPQSSATGSQPQDSEAARALAAQTRERILEQPEQAAGSAMGETSQEPAATRMSRAIEALS
ncbi:hypothetical protein [Halorhodospira neutriphila]|uniref:Uncharacterized protein n=1 Tax=Halorhodospira neutriphila TaxID=168379 RepID=A0ABS1E5A5_9GAMM|nr:hypothetical protein [Halorhodospira neutriphila]MBK1726931.1 hypothetical protein [Halorhodospira neutriphila]